MAALGVGRRSRLLGVSALVLGVGVHISPTWASAQPTASESGPLAQGVPVILGPPPPVPPAVISRDAAGRATLRAQRLEAPLTLDGVLSEEVYQTVPSATDFVQSEPNAGEPATQKTEVWIFFDDDNFYVTAQVLGEQPRADDRQRDAPRQPPTSGRTSASGSRSTRSTTAATASSFSVNPIGGRMDGQITDERQYNSDWNPIWDLAVGRFDGGWTVESGDSVQVAALPARAAAQVWGFNVRRINRWKNEIAYLTPIPPAPGAAALPDLAGCDARRARVAVRDRATSRSSRTRLAT